MHKEGRKRGGMGLKLQRNTGGQLKGEHTGHKDGIAVTKEHKRAIEGWTCLAQVGDCSYKRNIRG